MQNFTANGGRLNREGVNSEGGLLELLLGIIKFRAAASEPLIGLPELVASRGLLFTTAHNYYKKSCLRRTRGLV